MIELAFHLLVLLKSKQEKKYLSVYYLVIHVNRLSPEVAVWGVKVVSGGALRTSLMIGNKHHSQGLMAIINTPASILNRNSIVRSTLLPT